MNNDERAILTLDILENRKRPASYDIEDVKSAVLVQQLIREGFQYPEMFDIEPEDIFKLLPHVREIVFLSYIAASYIDTNLKGDYLIGIGNNHGEKSQMEISLIHEFIHIYLDKIIRLPVTTGLHWYLEKEIEFAAQNFVYSNKTFVEFLINNLDLFCERIQVINKREIEDPSPLTRSWEPLPEFLEKYVES